MASNHSLRERSTVDYATLNNGRKNSKKAAHTTDTLEQTFDFDNGKEIEDQNIVNKDVLKALETQAAALKLDIAVADKKREILKLQGKLESLSTPVTPRVTPLVSLKDLGKSKDLDDALSYLKDSHLDFLTQEATEKSSHHNDQGKLNLKAIPDFVTKPSQSSFSTSGSDKQKRLEDVTQAQWISANVWILLKLMGEGLDMAGVSKYLRYTAKIGDYLQMSDYGYAIVMLMDHEHKK